jgi:hypothetical protein
MASSQAIRRKLSIALELACWLLPASQSKNRLLTKFGHKSSVDGPHRTGHHRSTGSPPTRSTNNWIRRPERFFMGIKSRVGSRCYIDCSGTIVIRAFGAVGGVRCVLQSHQPDLERNRQSAGRITVGDHAWAYNIAQFKYGIDPTVVRDALYVSHRDQFAASESTFATAPATVIANIGGVIYSCDVGAGRTLLVPTAHRRRHRRPGTRRRHADHGAVALHGDEHAGGSRPSVPHRQRAALTVETSASVPALT